MPATAHPAGDDAAAVLAIEHAIWDAFVAGDWDALHRQLDGILFLADGQLVRWSAEITESRRAMGCTMRGYVLDDVVMERVGDDAMVVFYRIALDMTCPGFPAFPPLRYMSTFERTERGWKLRASASMAAG